MQPASRMSPLGARALSPARFSAPPWIIVLGGLAAAAITGFALAHSLKLGVAFTAACVFLPLVLLNLPLALAAWIPLAWIEYSHIPGKAPLAGILLLAVAWIGTRRVRGAVVAADASIRIARVSLALLLVWVTLSISWAGNQHAAWADVRSWYAAGAAFLIISTVAATRGRVRLVAFAFIAGALVALAVGLTSGGVSTTTGAVDAATRERFSGGAGDPNYLAAGLVAAIALAAGLLASTKDAIARLGLVTAIVTLAAGLVATESRGGLIAAGVAVVAALLLARERRAQTFTFAVFAVAVVSMLLLLSPSSAHRVLHPTADGTGRTELWSVATRMAADHPIVGVGVRNFQFETGSYVRRPGKLKFVAVIAERQAVAHDVYLQQLADTGVVGLALLLAAIGGCLAAAQAAARRFASAGDSSMAALARAAAVAMIGTLTASAFISNNNDDRLWIVLALGPALLTVARRASPGREIEPHSSAR